MKNKKETAINLRQNGKTCGEIVSVLDTPKSTVWSWIKNVALTEEIKKKISKKAKEKSRKNIINYNTKVRPIIAAEIRDAWIDQAKKNNKYFSK